MSTKRVVKDKVEFNVQVRAGKTVWAPCARHPSSKGLCGVWHAVLCRAVPPACVRARVRVCCTFAR
jgi:hypothetical protein